MRVAVSHQKREAHHLSERRHVASGTDAPPPEQLRHGTDAPSLELGVLGATRDAHRLRHVLLMESADHEALPRSRDASVKSLDGEHGVANVEQGGLGDRHPAERGGGHAEVLDLGQVAQMARLEDVRARREAHGTKPALVDGHPALMCQGGLGLGPGEREACRNVLPRGLRIAQKHPSQLVIAKGRIPLVDPCGQARVIADEHVSDALPPTDDEQAQPVLLGERELRGEGGSRLPLGEEALEIGACLDDVERPLPQGERERQRRGVGTGKIARVI